MKDNIKKKSAIKKSYDFKLVITTLIIPMIIGLISGLLYIFNTTVLFKAIFLLSTGGSVFLAISYTNYKAVVKQMSSSFDERFSFHYLKANNIAEQVGGFLMIMWGIYEFVVHNNILWPIIIIVIAIVISRSIALYFYQKTE